MDSRLLNLRKAMIILARLVFSGIKLHMARVCFQVMSQDRSLLLVEELLKRMSIST